MDKALRLVKQIGTISGVILLSSCLVTGCGNDNSGTVETQQSQSSSYMQNDQNEQEVDERNQILQSIGESKNRTANVVIYSYSLAYPDDVITQDRVTDKAIVGGSYYAALINFGDVTFEISVSDGQDFYSVIAHEPVSQETLDNLYTIAARMISIIYYYPESTAKQILQPLKDGQKEYVEYGDLMFGVSKSAVDQEYEVHFFEKNW